MLRFELEQEFSDDCELEIADILARLAPLVDVAVTTTTPALTEADADAGPVVEQADDWSTSVTSLRALGKSE